LLCRNQTNKFKLLKTKEITNQKPDEQRGKTREDQKQNVAIHWIFSSLINVHLNTKRPSKRWRN